jgi:hypothetical protein
MEKIGEIKHKVVQTWAINGWQKDSFDNIKNESLETPSE